MDQDVIVAELVMNDISQDKDDGWESGMAKLLYPDGIRKPDDAGKLLCGHMLRPVYWTICCHWNV